MNFVSEKVCEPCNSCTACHRKVKCFVTCFCLSYLLNIDLVQRVQNHAARLITGKFDYINCRGIDLIKSLNLYTIHERRDYFLTILMFKAIHGIAPRYLSDRIVMNFDVNGYDTIVLEGQIWIYISLHYTKRPIEIVLCIWVANCGINCLNLYKILGILNHLNVIIECTNLSLTHDQIDILIFFCNLSVSAWQWCNDYFPTLNKFRSVHGYGLLYFTRHRV